MKEMDPWLGEAEWVSQEGGPEAVTPGLKLTKGSGDFAVGRKEH